MGFLQKKFFWFNRDYVLVLSGGGFRGFYTIGVLKGLEEFGIDAKIKAIYGVSIGAVIGSLRASGKNADEIYDLLGNVTLGKFYSKDIFKKTGGLLSNTKIKKLIEQNIPESFSDLSKKMYIGTVDTNTAQYHIFNSGDLQQIVLGSMSIPGVFPPVKYKHYSFVDGGILNNFPVDLAKEHYPHSKIIGVALNWFEKDQIIKSAKDNLMVTFQIILRAKQMEDTKKVDILFYRNIPLGVLSFDKVKMKKAYDMGYRDCVKTFKK